MFPKNLKDPTYLPTRQEIETWRGLGSCKLDNWDDYVNHNPLGFSFEILNKDFLESFVEYLKSRVDELIGQNRKHIRIVETGAGNGRLGYFLREKMKGYSSKISEIITTDDLSWENDDMNMFFPIRRHFPVVQMNYNEALELDPDIVITSWMPLNEDWTREYRKRTSVEEYILIGNREDCGNQDTWNADIVKNDHFGISMPKIKGQMCFRDNPGYYGHSITTSFRRK